MDIHGYHHTSSILSDVALPQELVTLLPGDPYLQLELAHRIVCHAYSKQVPKLLS